MYFHPITTNFQIDQIFHHLIEQTLYHQSNNTYIVLHIYICAHWFDIRRKSLSLFSQIRVKAEVEDKSSVNKQNGVTASSSTVFRTVFSGGEAISQLVETLNAAFSARIKIYSAFDQKAFPASCKVAQTKTYEL